MTDGMSRLTKLSVSLRQLNPGGHTLAEGEGATDALEAGEDGALVLTETGTEGVGDDENVDDDTAGRPVEFATGSGVEELDRGDTADEPEVVGTACPDVTNTVDVTSTYDIEV